MRVCHPTFAIAVRATASSFHCCETLAGGGSWPFCSIGTTCISVFSRGVQFAVCTGATASCMPGLLLLPRLLPNQHSMQSYLNDCSIAIVMLAPAGTQSWPAPGAPARAAVLLRHCHIAHDCVRNRSHLQALEAGLHQGHQHIAVDRDEPRKGLQRTRVLWVMRACGEGSVSLRSAP